MTHSRQQRSLSIGAEAAAYERGRPTYPPEAIDWLLPPGARDVLDLGAGTGKLTMSLVERGLGVFAVDPIPVSQIFDDYGPFGTANNQVFRRCHGGATQPIAGSNPFSSPPFPGPPVGAPTTPGDCDATNALPGP